MDNNLCKKLKLMLKLMSLDIPNIALYDRFKFVSEESFNEILHNFENMTDEELARVIQLENFKYKIYKIDIVSERLLNFFLDNVDITKNINVHLLDCGCKLKDYKLYTLTNESKHAMAFIKAKTTKDSVDIYFITLCK